MYKITKQFDFCYGHRVWTQKLNPEFSLDSCHACRRLHGHQGTINICLESEKLVAGMVTDFKHLNFFKKWLDDTLDHKFIMDMNDPAKSHLFIRLRDDQYHHTIKEQYIESSIGKTKYYTVNADLYEGLPNEVCEIYEGLVFVDFVPTSENLSKWLLDIVQEKMKPLGVKVSQVQFFETPKSQSIYIA